MNLFNGWTIEEYLDALGADVSHIRVVDKEDARIRGFGSASSRELALVKAVSELYERRAVLNEASTLGQPLSSSGFAAHRTQVAARQSARDELIERDAVLCSWFTRSAPEWMSGTELPEYFSSFLRAGFTCRLGLSAVAQETEVWISILYPESGNSFGMMFASAAGANRAQVFETLFLNQRRNITYALGAQEHIDCESQVRRPEDHRTYYLDPRRNQKWRWLRSMGKVKVDSLEIPIRIDDIAVEGPTPWPVFVSRARSNRLQGYFAGETTASRLNWPRLQSYSSRSEVNEDLHPLA